MIPLTRIVKYEDHVDKLADRIAFDMSHASQCCGGDWKTDDFFRIVIKPFMDAYTYDQDRIDECCVHVVRSRGPGRVVLPVQHLGAANGRRNADIVGRPQPALPEFFQAAG